MSNRNFSSSYLTMHRANKTIASNYLSRQQQGSNTLYGSALTGNFSNSVITEVNAGMPANYVNNCEVEPGACGCVASPPKPCTIHDNEGIFQWVQNIFPDSAENIPETVRPFSVTTDKFGNIYYAGMYNSQNDIPLRNAGTQGTGNVNSGIILPSSFIYYPDPDYYVAIFAPFLIKLDPNGVVQWAFRIYQSYVVPGTDYLSLNGVVTDSQGNVYISGQYLTVNTINPNPPNPSYTSALSYDLSNSSGVTSQQFIDKSFIPINTQPSMYLIKIGTNGNYIISTAYGATNKVSYYNAITIDSNDNIYIAGSHNETVQVNGLTRTPTTYTITTYAGKFLHMLTQLSTMAPSTDTTSILSITKNKNIISILQNKIFIQPFPKLSYNTDAPYVVDAKYKIDTLADINDALKQQLQYTTPFIISLLKYPSSLASVLEQNFSGQTGDGYTNGVYTDNTNVYITGGYITANNTTNIDTLYGGSIILPSTNSKFTTFLAKYVNSNLRGVWATYIYNNNNIFGFSIGGDSLKNIYLVGQYDNSQTDLYNASSTGSYTMSTTKLPASIGGVYVIKYNSAGVVQWQIPFNYGLNGITTDVYNNFYVIGIYGGSPPIYNSATGTNINTSTANLPGTGGPITAVIKYDSSGLLQWYMGFNYITASLGFGVTQNSLNCASNVYICGSYVNGSNELMTNATPSGTQSNVKIAGPTPNTSDINRDSSYVFKLF